MSKAPKDSKPSSKSSPKLKTLDVTKAEASKVKGGAMATVKPTTAPAARNLDP